MGGVRLGAESAAIEGGRRRRGSATHLKPRQVLSSVLQAVGQVVDEHHFGGAPVLRAVRGQLAHCTCRGQGQRRVRAG